MNSFPDITNELPAPRDDEPSSLRQNIADELADHLQSSFVGELHRTPDQNKAKQHVLERFGDPRRVARQLWFDAMKEKIMSQRVLITALVVTAVACLGSTGLTFMLVEQSRQASQALVDQVERSQKSNEAFLKESREANAAVIEKLSALATPVAGRETGPATSMEWNPVKFRLVKDKSGGPPAEGYEVILEGHVLDTANKNSIARNTGADGLADLGVVRPGQHALRITTPWKELQDRQITVLPGQALTEEIVCPAASREELPVSFAVDWPDELQNRGFWTVCLAVYENRQIDGEQWRPAWGSNYRLLIVTAENEMFSHSDNYGYESPEHPFRFRSEPPIESPGLYFDVVFGGRSGSARSGRNSESPPASPPIVAKPIRPYHFQFPKSPRHHEEHWPAGRYTLQNILVAEGPSDDPSAGWQTVDVLGGMITRIAPNLPSPSKIRQHPFDDWVESGSRLGKPNEYQRRAKETPSFEVQPGALNQIKIPIPPKLAENVRRFLEESK